MTHATRYSGFGAELYVVVNDEPKLLGGLYGDVPLVDDSVELIDVTGHDSPKTAAGKGRREHLGGLIDGSERTFNFYRDPDDSEQNELYLNVGETMTFQVNHPAWPNRQEFDAVVMGIRELAQLEDALVFELTLKQSGDQTPVVGP